MNRLARIETGLVAFVLLFAAAQPVEAVCSNYRSFTATGSYIYTPGVDWQYGSGSTRGYLGSTVSPNLRGSFWHVGNADPIGGVGNDSGEFAALGSFPEGGWVRLYPNYGASLLGSWSTGGAYSGIDGCIDSPYSEGTSGRCMAIYLEDVDPYTADSAFALLTSPADPNLNYDFAPSAGGPITLAPFPRPWIVGSTRLSGLGVRVEILGPDADDLEPGLYLASDGDCADVDITDLIRGYRACTATLDRGGSYPSPDDFVCHGSVLPLGSTARVTVDCDWDVNIWVSYRLVFDRNTLGTSMEAKQAGGSSARIECGPNLVDVPEERTAPRERPPQPGRQRKR